MTDQYERELVNRINETSFLAHRHAGSEGEAGDVSLCIPGFPARSALIEQKTSQKDDVNLKSGGINYDQFLQLREYHEEGFCVWYAVRHTRGSRDHRWRFHWMKSLLNDVYPHILRREDGLTFDEFLDFLEINNG